MPAHIMSYDKEVIDKVIQDFSDGVPLTECCKKYKVSRSSLWEWTQVDHDGLKAKFLAAKKSHDQAVIDEMRTIVDPDSHLILHSNRGVPDTSLIRQKIDANEKYLRFRAPDLIKRPEFQKLGVDISQCNSAKDVQDIIKQNSTILSKIQLDMLLSIHASFIKTEEHHEMREMLEKATIKLKELEERNS